MSDEDNLLASLEAHGREFLTRFPDLGTKREAVQDYESLHIATDVTSLASSFDDGPEEWTGFASTTDLGDIDEVPERTRLEAGSAGNAPDVVVFSERTSMSHAHGAFKAQDRSFMSSKVSRLKESTKAINDSLRDVEDEGHELSDIHNDTLLQRLIHTQLLTGSLNHELNMTAAQRRKALAGRVLELAGDSKLGKGESNVRQDEKKKASKRVRDGMRAKQKERDVKLLTEAKAVGNYHPALKRLFSASSSTQSRKRVRGLKMGIGKFSGGMLKLTTGEISSIQNVRNARDRGLSRKRGN